MLRLLFYSNLSVIKRKKIKSQSAIAYAMATDLRPGSVGKRAPQCCAFQRVEREVEALECTEEQKSEPKKRRSCWTCREEGHYTPSCPNKVSGNTSPKVTHRIILNIATKRDACLPDGPLCEKLPSYLYGFLACPSEHWHRRIPTNPLTEPSQVTDRRYRRLFLSFKVIRE